MTTISIFDFLLINNSINKLEKLNFLLIFLIRKSYKWLKRKYYLPSSFKSLSWKYVFIIVSSCPSLATKFKVTFIKFSWFHTISWYLPLMGWTFLLRMVLSSLGLSYHFLSGVLTFCNISRTSELPLSYSKTAHKNVLQVFLSCSTKACAMFSSSPLPRLTSSVMIVNHMWQKDTL